jgi:two-component system cell cycle sensor histidine kinase/response regulator CckA
MSRNQKKPPISWALVGVFAVVSSVIIISGSVYISNQKQNTLDIKKEELNAFANLKAGQVVRWWHERLGNAIILKENYPLVEEIDFYLKNTDNKQSREAIEQLLSSIINTFDYKNAVIVDNSGRVKLAIPEGDTLIEHYMQPLIPTITAGRKVNLTDLHQVSSKKPVQLDLVVPLELKRKSELRPIGTIIMQLDPEKILFPIIELLPTQSKTSETLLLRKDGDSIVYLNELRHIVSNPLSVKRSVSDTNLLGSKAVRGFVGVAEGVDYRGVRVLGAIKKIPGTGWYMVSKVDMKEIRGIINNEVIPVILLIFLMISSFGALIGWFIWHQRVRFYRDNYEAELEKMMLRKHFDYILKYANDIILLMDSDLNIVETNDHALEVYQYQREEMINADIRLLRLPGSDAELIKNRWNHLPC